MSDFMARMTGPGRGQIKLNGEDVSGSVVGYDVSARVGEVNCMMLEVRIDEIYVDGEARVVLPQGTEEVLINLGWTPPGVVEVRKYDGGSGSSEGSSPQG